MIKVEIHMVAATEHITVCRFIYFQTNVIGISRILPGDGINFAVIILKIKQPRSQRGFLKMVCFFPDHTAIISDAFVVLFVLFQISGGGTICGNMAHLHQRVTGFVILADRRIIEERLSLIKPGNCDMVTVLFLDVCKYLLAGLFPVLSLCSGISQKAHCYHDTGNDSHQNNPECRFFVIEYRFDAFFDADFTKGEGTSGNHLLGCATPQQCHGVGFLSIDVQSLHHFFVASLLNISAE